MTERPEWFIRKLASCFLNRQKQTMEVATEAVCMIRAHLKVVPPTFIIPPFLSIKVVFWRHTHTHTKIDQCLIYTGQLHRSQGTIINDILKLSGEVPVPASVFIHFEKLSKTSFRLTLTDQCCPNLIIIMQITPSLCVWMLGEALRYREKLCMNGLL